MKLTRRPVLFSAAVALLLAVAAFAITLGVVASGSDEYEARSAVVAAPREASDPAIQSFGSVVSLTLPGVADLVTSPSTIAAVQRQVPGAPDDLADRVTVGVVPASGLARISVRAGSPQLAADLAQAFQQQAIAANLLAPAGELTPLGAPAIEKVSPDWTLALGFALAAAVIVGAIAFGLCRILLGGGLRRTRRALVAAGITRSVAVMYADDAELVDTLRLLANAAAKPLRLVAVDPATDLAPLWSRIGEAKIPMAHSDHEDAAVVAVGRSGDSPNGIALVTSALPQQSPLVAVILTRKP